jgi:hypothetical protein
MGQGSKVGKRATHGIASTAPDFGFQCGMRWVYRLDRQASAVVADDLKFGIFQYHMFFAQIGRRMPRLER